MEYFFHPSREIFIRAFFDHKPGSERKILKVQAITKLCKTLTDRVWRIAYFFIEHHFCNAVVVIFHEMLIIAWSNAIESCD